MDRVAKRLMVLPGRSPRDAQINEFDDWDDDPADVAVEGIEHGPASAESCGVGLLHPVRDEPRRWTSTPERSRGAETDRNGFLCNDGPCSNQG